MEKDRLRVGSLLTCYSEFRVPVNTILEGCDDVEAVTVTLGGFGE